MRLKYLIGLAACIACSQPHPYRITGSLPDAQDGYVVKLYDTDNTEEVLLDSTIVMDECFELVGKQVFDHPKYCTLVVDMTPQEANPHQKTLKAYRFFADNTAMEFRCQIDSMPGYYWEPVNKEHHVSLKGAPVQDLYLEYKIAVRELTEQKAALWQEYLKVYHIPAFDGIFHTEEGMRIAREMKAVKKQLTEITREFIQKHNQSVVSLLLAEQLLYMNRSELTITEIDDLVNSFDPVLQNADMMGKVRKTAEKMRCIARGIDYHDIRLTNQQGGQVNLSAYIKPGMYNMLEFWASWCSPCRAEIPHLRHLYQICGKKHFNMISISIDEREVDWKKAVEEEQMEWTQLCDLTGRKGPVRTVYKIEGVPYCIVLDPEGKIVCGGVRGAELDVVVTDLLGDKIHIQ